MQRYTTSVLPSKRFYSWRRRDNIWSSKRRGSSRRRGSNSERRDSESSSSSGWSVHELYVGRPPLEDLGAAPMFDRRVVPGRYEMFVEIIETEVAGFTALARLLQGKDNAEYGKAFVGLGIDETASYMLEEMLRLRWNISWDDCTKKTRSLGGCSTRPRKRGWGKRSREISCGHPLKRRFWQW